jgi:isoprenylcysteine carboxyl methyltransferase (ICMT) family protein YpbQ
MLCSRCRCLFIQLEELFPNRTSLHAGTTDFGASNSSLLLLCYQYFFIQLLLTAAIDHHFNCTVPRSRTGNATDKTPED